MQNHLIKVDNKMRKRKRVGRGGNYATYARRGRDGQLSRSGGRTAVRLKVGRKGGYFKSMPLLGGFKSVHGSETEHVNISKIISNIDKIGTNVDINVLKKYDIISAKARKVKVIGDKKKKSVVDFDNNLNFSKDISFSRSAEDVLGVKTK